MGQMSEFQLRCAKMGLTPRQTGIVLAKVCPDSHIEALRLGIDALEFAESKSAQLSDVELQAAIFDAISKYPKAFE